MEDKKRETDELIQELDRMLKENKSKEEIDEVLRKLKKLLKEYLDQ